MHKDQGYQFIEQTKYPNLSEPGQKQGLPQPPFEIPLEAGKPLVDLPKPENLDFGDTNLRKVIEDRRTIRHYSDTPLSLAELAYLLWLTQGIVEINPKRNVPLRNVPSAGCRHPFETYLAVNRVEGLQPGLYRYASSTHQLVFLEPDSSFSDKLAEACLGQRHVATSAANFIWAAVTERTTWRYSERSYRYFYLDAGHVCQNLHLAAESIDCGLCAIGAYDDDAVDGLMGFSPPEMFVCYMATVGKK